MRAVLTAACNDLPEASGSAVRCNLKLRRRLPRHGRVPHVLRLRGLFYPIREELFPWDVLPGGCGLVEGRP